VAAEWSVTLGREWEEGRPDAGRGGPSTGEERGGRQREKERWGKEDERRKKMMQTNGTRMSLRGE
jgi:hypothetical protein